MAFIGQATKQLLAPNIKAVLKKYGVKGSISIKGDCVLLVTLREGSLDFNPFKEYQSSYSEFDIHHSTFRCAISLNREHVKLKAYSFLKELFHVMNGENYSRYDDVNQSSDYRYFSRVVIGSKNKNYKLV